MTRDVTAIPTSKRAGADMPRIPPRLARSRRGLAIVEFALGSGVLLAAFAGTFNFGYTLIQYNKLQTAVGQGVRYASLVPYDSATTVPSPAFLSAVRNMVLYGSPAGGNTPILNDLPAEDIDLSVTFANGVPSSMTVSITGYTIYALFGTHQLTNKPRVTYAYQGVWAPV
jgi:hypothetical protein